MVLKKYLKLSYNFYIFVIFLILLFFISYMHNNNIGFLILFFSIYFFVISLFLAYKNINSINISYIDNEKFFANKKSKILFKIESKNVSYDIRVKNYIFNILKKETIFIDFVFKKRGLIKSVNLNIFSYFPFGLYEFFKDFKIDVDIIVFPEPKGVSLKNFIKSSLDLKEEFDGIRKYQEGDTIKDIFWPSVAKGEIKSKKFISTQNELIFDYDSLNLSKEDRLSQITLWILEANKEGLLYKVKLNNKIYSSSKGLYEILKILALY